MNDCVWTVGHHPSLCGTEKFSHQLAARLGIPVVAWGTPCDAPLISCLASEAESRWWLEPPQVFDLFLHDHEPRFPDFTLGFTVWIQSARRLIAANSVIAAALLSMRPDVITAWCPSTLQGNPTRGKINVLTFGMAHKIKPEYYIKLKALLDDVPTTYTVSVSTAIHEGSPWDETAKVADKLRGIFGEHLRVLGYLADDALVREIDEATAVAIFYDPALRENNTSAWAVLERARPLITNIDADSPAFMYYDIDGLKTWPTFPSLPPQGLSEWDNLIECMTTEVLCHR